MSLQCSSRVKTLTDRFAALEQQATEAHLHNGQQPRNVHQHARNPQFVCKVRAVRIGDVDTLMTEAIQFLIKQTELGFYEHEDLFRYPKHGEGPRRKCFFTKLFAREVTLNDWNPTELVSAHCDLKSLNFSQLLFLWQVAASSGRTARGVQYESCNREHVSFKDAVQSLVFDRILLQLISPRRKGHDLSVKQEDGSKRPDGSSSARPRRNSTAQPDIVERRLQSRPCDDISWPLTNASAVERRAVGRELLVVLGLICRIVSGKGGHPGTQQRKLTRSHTSESDIFRPASVPDDGPDSTGVWWRVFVPRPHQSQLMGPRETTAPPIREWRADSLAKHSIKSGDITPSHPLKPMPVSEVTEPRPSSKKQTTPHRRQNSTRSEPPKQEKRVGPPENYLIRARCALRPVQRSSALPPKASLPRPIIPTPAERVTRTKILEQISNTVQSSGKAQTTPALPNRQGSWRRGVSLFHTSTAPTPGIELFLHFPSLRVSTHRPSGIGIFSYTQQAGMSSLLTAATGGGFNSAVVWDVIRFAPDAPSLNHVSIVESLSACMDELKLVLMARKKGPPEEMGYTTDNRASFSFSDAGVHPLHRGTTDQGLLRRLSPTEETNSSTSADQRPPPPNLSFDHNEDARSASPPRPRADREATPVRNIDPPNIVSITGEPSLRSPSPHQIAPEQMVEAENNGNYDNEKESTRAPQIVAKRTIGLMDAIPSVPRPIPDPTSPRYTSPPPPPLMEPAVPEFRRADSWNAQLQPSRRIRAGRTFDASVPVFNGRRLGPRAHSPPKTIPSNPVPIPTPRREKTTPVTPLPEEEVENWSTGRPRSGAFAAPPLSEKGGAQDFVLRMERLSEVARVTTPATPHSPPRPVATSWTADDRELMSVVLMPLTSEISTINDIPLLDCVIRKKKRKPSSRHISMVTALELTPPAQETPVEPIHIPYARLAPLKERRPSDLPRPLPPPLPLNLGHFKHLDPLRLSERCAGWPCVGGESTPRPPETQSERPVGRRRSDGIRAEPPFLLLPKHPGLARLHMDRTRSLNEVRPPTPRSRNILSPAELARMKRPPSAAPVHPPPPTAVPEPIPPQKKPRPSGATLSSHHHTPKN